VHYALTVCEASTTHCIIGVLATVGAATNVAVNCTVKLPDVSTSAAEYSHEKMPDAAVVTVNVPVMSRTVPALFLIVPVRVAPVNTSAVPAASVKMMLCAGRVAPAMAVVSVIV
jgi:hypothetical protein